MIHNWAVSWTLVSVWESNVCFLYIWELKSAQETDPTKMHVLLYRLQSGGPDPNWEKLDPMEEP